VLKLLGLTVSNFQVDLDPSEWKFDRIDLTYLFELLHVTYDKLFNELFNFFRIADVVLDLLIEIDMELLLDVVQRNFVDLLFQKINILSDFA
jgi:hypothetical protein